MKTLFIPKGTIMRHESVDAERIVVKGTLYVDGELRAKRICSDGTVVATTISAREIKADILEAGTILSQKVIANKILCKLLYASVGIIARD